MALKVFDKKFYRYVYLRLIRQNGSPHALALSVGLGVFFGFLIPVFQMLFAIFFAWIFKGNKIVAAACTWVSNPITIPVLFPFNVYLGSFFINSEFNFEMLNNITLSTLFKDLPVVLSFFASDGMLMFMIGGAIIGSIIAFISYGLVFYLVKKHKMQKQERYYKRQQKLNEKTGMPS